MKNNVYQGAYSRRRFSNYAVVGKETTSATSGTFSINAASGDPGMGTVQVALVGGTNSQFGTSTPMQGDRSAASRYPTYKVTALPFDGCRFAGWTGDFPAGQQRTNPIVVTLNKNIILTASFERIENSYTISVGWDSSMGRVTANGLQNGRMSATPGSQVTLEATPKDGYVFKRWEGVNLAGNLQDNTSRRITITMPARDLSLTAVFAKVVDNPGGGGGTPGGGNSDDVPVVDPSVMPSPVVSGTEAITAKVVPFVKKWWWAIAIALWLYYDSKKGGMK